MTAGRKKTEFLSDSRRGNAKKTPVRPADMCKQAVRRENQNRWFAHTLKRENTSCPVNGYRFYYSVLLLHTPVKQVPYSIIELYYLLLC